MTRSSATHLFLLLYLLTCCELACATPVIHKCIDANGIASYQNLACTDAEQQVWSRHVATPAPTPEAVVTSVAMPRSTSRHGGAGRPHTMPGRRRDGESTPSAPPPSPGKGRRSKRARSAGRRDAAYAAEAALIPLNPNAATPACAGARRRREDTLERVGLKRSYSLLQKLDDGVQRACQ